MKKLVVPAVRHDDWSKRSRFLGRWVQLLAQPTEVRPHQDKLTLDLAAFRWSFSKAR
jgi:hypothetical protein